MQKLNLILISLLITFSGCSPWALKAVLKEIKPVERCVLSQKFNKCRCHQYDFLKAERVSDSYDKEITYCENLIGFRPDEWKKVNSYLLSLKALQEQGRSRPVSLPSSFVGQTLNQTTLEELGLDLGEVEENTTEPSPDLHQDQPYNP